MKIILYSLVICLIAGCVNTSLVQNGHMTFYGKKASKKIERIKERFMLNPNFFYPKYTKKTIKYFSEIGGKANKDGSISDIFLSPIKTKKVKHYKKKHPYSTYKVLYDNGIAKESRVDYGSGFRASYYDDKQRTVVKELMDREKGYHHVSFIVHQQTGTEHLECDMNKKECEYRFWSNLLPITD